MYSYVLTACFAWIVYKIVSLLWQMKEKRRLHETIPDLPDRHWFWGHLHKVQCMDDILKLVKQYVAEATPTMFSMWMMFMSPVLNPVHPSTLKVVLTARNIPKNADLAGPYRFLKTWIGDGLICSKGEKWERNRRLLTPAFHFDILRTYIDVFNHVGDTFVSRVMEASTSGQSFDIYPMVSRATLDTMLRCTLSYEDDSVQSTGTRHPYVAAVHRMLSLIMYRSINPLLYPDFIYDNTPTGREFKRLGNYVHSFADDIIAARMDALEKDPTKLDKQHLDFLDILLSARDGDGRGLTDKEIRDEVDTFMFAGRREQSRPRLDHRDKTLFPIPVDQMAPPRAILSVYTFCCTGHDSTASAVSWTINNLAKYPIMQQNVREEVETVLNGHHNLKIDDMPELTYMTCFIKEVLRLYTPVPITQRKLAEPLTLQGTRFPPGQQIDVYHYVVHRNPALWDNPEEFRPDRFFPENVAKQDPFAYIPFSAGKRNCIGQNFAMNEIKVIIAKVVHRFRISTIPEREAIPYPEGVMRSKNGIYLNFEEI